MYSFSNSSGEIVMPLIVCVWARFNSSVLGPFSISSTPLEAFLEGEVDIAAGLDFEERQKHCESSRAFKK